MKKYLSLIPFAALIALIATCVSVFGTEALEGATQVSLLIASAVCVLVGYLMGRVEWELLEREMTDKIASCMPSIIILLLIGAIGSTWMVSGIVPTMIYYGVQVLRPEWFLISSSIFCALVSLMVGSSWTTVATIGVALMGIGRAHGFDDGWVAGSIITGAYFGDKLSPLSDTTVLASSVSGTPLFTHIRYMMKTTIPTFLISLLIFTMAGLLMKVSGSGEVSFLHQLKESFMISPWLLLVPVVTGVMIARRWPAMVVLFLAAMMAAVVAVVWQPALLSQIAENSWYESIMKVIYGSTQLQTGAVDLDQLVHTNGMAGMMPTVWLIICAQVFGGVVTATGVLGDVMQIILHFVHGTASLVASTALTGIFCNIALSDQFLSIILTSSMFKDVYRERGYEPRLLSRTCEDGATVTSVLVPWNTCGLVQSTVLGVATLAYLPYCFFNFLSPVTSVIVAASGRVKGGDKANRHRVKGADIHRERVHLLP
ncbi:MAG: sodium:proton antiporter [Bacteroidaceae bacterium]|nr:sodium:proton antiporter [Bacteroidaceae bacterium]